MHFVYLCVAGIATIKSSTTNKNESFPSFNVLQLLVELIILNSMACSLPDESWILKPNRFLRRFINNNQFFESRIESILNKSFNPSKSLLLIPIIISGYNFGNRYIWQSSNNLNFTAIRNGIIQIPFGQYELSLYYGIWLISRNSMIFRGTKNQSDLCIATNRKIVNIFDNNNT